MTTKAVYTDMMIGDKPLRCEVNITLTPRNEAELKG